MLTDAQRHIDFHAFDELNRITKAIVHNGLKSLVNEIERMQNCSFYHTINSKEVVEFHQQIIAECLCNLTMIEKASEIGDLSLLEHFGK